MAGVAILKDTTAHPGDLTPFDRLIKASTEYEPSSLLAVIGKTEGNGCVNDYTRMLSATVWDPLLVGQDGISVFSGGTEGVLSPHVSLVVREPDHVAADGSKKYAEGLVAAVGHTRDFAPHEMGTAVQAHEVAKEVSRLMADLAVAEDQVHMVLVKCPLLTTAKVAASAEPCVTTDTYKSMGYSRLATALGISLALGELAEEGLGAALDSYGVQGWSSRASCSSGAELENCHIVVLAVSSKASNPYRATHGYMADAIDFKGLYPLVQEASAAGAAPVQIFVKAEPSTDGVVRGMRHTMMTDSDIQGTRHARAAVGGLVAGLWGTPDVYVSGGAEGQGPMGGGSVCVVYKLAE
ncbi:cyanuric acid hydrolase/Barbiturase [Dipodascopsis tothii]|uniref:cyanuric acid hydrolase/Barbiturase n=1 Tax=Dipodascopsis tothii TaxID=44089 RepID=UPI0034CE5AE6